MIAQLTQHTELELINAVICHHAAAMQESRPPHPGQPFKPHSNPSQHMPVGECGECECPLHVGAYVCAHRQGTLTTPENNQVVSDEVIGVCLQPG
jgi:hypothetical protein